MGNEVTLVHLDARPDAIPLLAHWYFTEWNGIERLTLETLTGELHERLADPTIGLTYLALSGAAVIGTVSLDRCDLPGHEARTPWLASLYVCPRARGRGLGRRLINHVIGTAAARGCPHLFLWTAGSPLRYEAVGFSTVETASYGGQPIRIMQTALA